MSLATRGKQNGAGARKPAQDSAPQNRRPAWKTNSYVPGRTGTPPATNPPAASNGQGFPPLNASATASDPKPATADASGSAPNGSATPSNDSFRTDTEISQTGTGARAQRELQAWQAPAEAPGSQSSNAPRGDDLTFGASSGGGGGSWDQFVANEQMFGVTTSFDEDVYTTKLDRSGPDFKERERKAQQIANEILGASTNNPHLAEERGQADDSGVGEEDKYGAVVRGAGAYVPPGARKGPVNGTGEGNTSATPSPALPAAVAGAPATVAAAPKVKINSPDDKNANPTAGVVGDFRDFMATEKKRLEQKRQSIIKNDRDKRVADLVNFSKTFKLGKPIPEDLVPILAKDEEKQKLIREKSVADASANTARSIGPTSTTGTNPNGTPVLAPTTSTNANNSTSTRKPAAAAGSPAKTAAPVSAAKKPAMLIQKIPPFNPEKARQRQTEVAVAQPTAPASPTTEAARLNVNAPTFKPGSTTVSPTGSGPSAASAAKPATPSATTSPKVKAVEPATGATVNNPFFGVRPAKKAAPVHIKDDFNPFKFAKVAEPSNITAMWPYNGKRYLQSYPAPPPQAPAPPPHMPPAAAPGPPPPQPQYEEDPNNQQNQQNQMPRPPYVMYYPQYYPGQYMPPQPMMPGAPGAPPPPGYIHAGFVPHMYPAPMPHGAHGQPMYPSPPMPGMPPPQQYMHPPGAYPAPPGSTPGSMPPTPMPAHAAYYHPGPQYAYPMMMAPPPGGAPGAPGAVPQHGYPGVPPQQGVPMPGPGQHQ
ncbi:hypothetical protein BKA62DRAFT_686521 [Auriculariales sp. MPI-PUGE-AT-0066]|nr:hypothetical protein BKA62DRAFT_686521 [Auriculariales sp. MPI-PUGE-AT-0066]